MVNMDKIQKEIDRLVKERGFTVETLSQENPNEYLRQKIRDEIFPIVRIEEKKIFGITIKRKEVRELIKRLR